MNRPHLSIAATSAVPAPSATSDQVRPLLGDILAEQGLVTRGQISSCLQRQRTMNVRLGDMLRSDAGLTDNAILAALERQWAARRLDLGTDPPDGMLAQEMGLAHCLKARCMPWRRIGAATVIAVVYPDLFVKHRAEYEARFGTVMMALITEADLQESIALTFPQDVRSRSETHLPETDSCRSWPGGLFRAIMLGTVGTLAAATIVSPSATFALLMIVALTALLALTGLKAMACYTALIQSRERPPEPERVVQLHPPAHLQRPVVSLLVPLFREERIAGHLLRRLARLKYPHALLDICLVVDAEDKVTRTCLAATILPPSVRVIVVPDGSVRTKPRAMNYALDHCRGSIVGVYDAEDAPEPDQIAHVVSRFAVAPEEVACLQGRLSFYNARQNWLSRCFTIDYAIWFGMILPGVARLNMPIPLGGTTIFFRKHVLEQLGRWDAFNVTEDADLGIRLARFGYRTELIDSTTLEEANCRIWPWVRQRSRWLKGYAMTYVTHMRHPRRLWSDLGPLGFLGFQVMFLASLVQAITAPILWTWWLVAFGLPHPLTGALGFYGLAAITGLLVLAEAVNLTLAAMALRRAGRRWMLPWVLTLNLYYMMTTLAAVKALIEMMYKPFFWDKTEHGVPGSHTETSLASG
ncbi:glycosyltransferase [Meridianimarinicoccus aquatilis]|uniref:Glycosyltransferase n=1 Tax=Meridianimarinicoccus aquatilis TaxID=2552766 RepID=A0A4V3BCQ3_9RHOB|nr:glycosyltransferase [Fluviibacterium aquatile]TDL91199.1 glycosyltransferase [Fluviibacterium aquatile]